MIQKGLISLIQNENKFLPPGVDLFSQSEALLGLFGNLRNLGCGVFWSQDFSQDFFQKKMWSSAQQFGFPNQDSNDLDSVL